MITRCTRKWKSSHKRLGQCLGYSTCRSRPRWSYLVIQNSTEKNQRVTENVLHSGGNNLRDSASYALDRYRTLIGNYIRPIEWHHLRALTAEGVPEVTFGTRRIPLSVGCGSYVALSQHLLSFSLITRWSFAGTASILAKIKQLWVCYQSRLTRPSAIWTLVIVSTPVCL